MIIVGSKALEYFKLERKQPLDIDVWYSQGESTDPRHDSLCIDNEILKLIPTKDGFATPDAIYTIKCSHFAWDIKWEKTKQDILWLKAKGCKLIPEIYYKLKQHWEVENGGKSFLSLDKEKNEFFKDFVSYKYDHDLLHELAAKPNKPTYEKCLVDGKNVLTDKNKFFNMKFKDQIQMFHEEITVIACERWLLNDYWKGEIDLLQAHMFSLKKTITSLTKNWACDFIIHNLEQFVKPNKKLYFNILNQLEGNKMSNKKHLDKIKSVFEIPDDADIDNVIYNLADGDVFDEINLSRLIDGFSDMDWKQRGKAVDDKLEQLGYKHLVQEGGGEGGSEYCFGVFELQGVTYKASYSYRSYDGDDSYGCADSLKVVEAKEKTVIVYE